MRPSIMFKFATAMLVVACVRVQALRKLEADSTYPTCSFNNGVCAPTAAAALSIPKPVMDLEMVLAKSAAYSFLCNQHTTASACTADTANYCVYDPSVSPACDIDANKVPFLDTSSCPNPVDDPTKFTSSSASCRLAFQALYSCYAYTAGTCPTSYCSKGNTTTDDACAFHSDKPSFVLVFDGASSAVVPFGTALRPIADKCAAAATAAACAAVGAVTVDAAVATSYRSLDVAAAKQFANLAGLKAVGGNVTALSLPPKSTGTPAATPTTTTTGTSPSTTPAFTNAPKDTPAAGSNTTAKSSAGARGASILSVLAAVAGAALLL